MGDSLDHVSSVVDRSSTEFSGGGAVGGTPPPQVSPVGSAGSKVSQNVLFSRKILFQKRKCKIHGFQNYGWIYAGRVAFIFSFLILLASIAIWIFAIRAIQHYNR